MKVFLFLELTHVRFLPGSLSHHLKKLVMATVREIRAWQFPSVCDRRLVIRTFF